jgi:hypothetical protein
VICSHIGLFYLTPLALLSGAMLRRSNHVGFSLWRLLPRSEGLPALLGLNPCFVTVVNACTFSPWLHYDSEHVGYQNAMLRMYFTASFNVHHGRNQLSHARVALPHRATLPQPRWRAGACELITALCEDVVSRAHRR